VLLAEGTTNQPPVLSACRGIEPLLIIQMISNECHLSWDSSFLKLDTIVTQCFVRAAWPP